MAIYLRFFKYDFPTVAEPHLRSRAFRALYLRKRF